MPNSEKKDLKKKILKKMFRKVLPIFLCRIKIIFEPAQNYDPRTEKREKNY